MPWEIERRNNRYCVIKTPDNTTVKCHDTRSDAVDHLRALFASEEEARELEEILRLLQVAEPRHRDKDEDKDRRPKIG